MTEPADEYGELDETKIFQALDDHGVEYVVVGGSAAILWGAQRATRDIDCVAHQTVENHRRLCGALEQMGNPRLRIEGVDDAAAVELSKQLLHPDFFARTAASTWRTDSGSVDFLSGIPDAVGETVSYDALRARATFAPTSELRIPVASLDDIIESKTAPTGRRTARLSRTPRAAPKTSSTRQMSRANWLRNVDQSAPKRSFMYV